MDEEDKHGYVLLEEDEEILKAQQEQALLEERLAKLKADIARRQKEAAEKMEEDDDNYVLLENPQEEDDEELKEKQSGEEEEEEGDSLQDAFAAIRLTIYLFAIYVLFTFISRELELSSMALDSAAIAAAEERTFAPPEVQEMALPLPSPSLRGHDAQGWDWEKEFARSGAILLNQDTFHEFVHEHETVLVFLYEPSGFRGREVFPQWRNYVQRLMETDKAELARVDCSQSRQLCRDYKLGHKPGYFRWFRQGEAAVVEEDSSEVGVRLVHARAEESKKDPLPPLRTAPFVERMASTSSMSSNNHKGPATILTLTQSNFQEAIQIYPHFLVNFGHPDCEWSQRLLPTWKRLSWAARDQRFPVKIASVNCASNDNIDVRNELCEELGIDGYPTIRWYSHGEFIQPEYSPNADRSVKSFLDYVQQNLDKETGRDLEDTRESEDEEPMVVAQPAEILQVKELDDLHDFVQRNPRVLVHLGNPGCEFAPQAMPVLQSLAQALQENNMPVKIASASPAFMMEEPCQAIEDPDLPFVRWYARGEWVKPDFHGDRSFEALLNYARMMLALDSHQELEKAEASDPAPRLIHEELEIPSVEPPMEEPALAVVEPRQSDIVFDWHESLTVLTENTFHEFLIQNKHAFIDFYMPWCQWSQKLRPQWNKYAQAVQLEKLPVGVASVDCMAFPNICREQGVSAYPTIRWFDNGEPSTKHYKGDRDVDALFYFTKETLASGPNNWDRVNEVREMEEEPPTAAIDEKPGHSESVPTTAIAQEGRMESDLASIKEVAVLTEATFQSFIHRHPHVFVHFSNPDCEWSQRLLPTWQKVAQVVQDEKIPAKIATLDCNESGDLCYELHIRNFPTIRWFSHGGSVTPDYKGDRTVDSFLEYSKSMVNFESSRGLVTHEGRLEEDQVDYPEHLYQALLRPFSAFYSIISHTAQRDNRVPEMSAVPSSGLSVVRLDAEGAESPSEGMVFAASAEIGSEGRPDAAATGGGESGVPSKAGVKLLTDSTFDEFLQQNPNAFILYYVPWCVWCQRVIPVWSEFAEAVTEAGIPVGIASLDCMASAEACRTQRVMSFPTLRWFDHGELSTPDYKGDRTKDAFLNYTRTKLGEASVQGWIRFLGLGPLLLDDDATIVGQSSTSAELGDPGLASSSEGVNVHVRGMSAEPADWAENPGDADAVESAGIAASMSQEPTVAEAAVTASKEGSLPRNGGAEVLTETTFDEFLLRNPIAFVDFYAPWCVWCKRMSSAWDDFAEAARVEGIPVAIASLDCMAHAETCRMQGIMQFPTLRWFQHGEHLLIDYKGDRTRDAFLDYARTKVGETLVKSWIRFFGLGPFFGGEGVGDSTDAKETVVLRQIPPMRDPQAFEFAVRSGGPNLHTEADNASAEETKRIVDRFVEQHPHVLAIDSPIVESGDATRPLELGVASSPKGTEVLTETNFHEFRKQHANAFVLYCGSRALWCHAGTPIMTTFALFSELASDLQLQVKLAKVDCHSNSKLCAEEDITSFPTLRWYDHDEPPKDYNGEITLEGLMKFRQELVDAKKKKKASLRQMENNMRSKETEAPKSQIVVHRESWVATPAGVSILTKHNFVKFLLEHPNVLVNFDNSQRMKFAELQASFDVLARRLGTNDVKVARIDCWSLGRAFCRLHEVTQYPTIRYYKNGEFQSQYSGSRKLDDLVRFAMSNKETNTGKNSVKLDEDMKMVVGADAAVSIQ